MLKSSLVKRDAPLAGIVEAASNKDRNEFRKFGDRPYMVFFSVTNESRDACAGFERRTLVLRNESALREGESERARSLVRSRARAPRVIYPSSSPASLRVRSAGCRSAREVEGSSSIIGITGLPRASSCLVGTARRRSAGFVRRRQSRTSSRALRICVVLRSRPPPRLDGIRRCAEQTIDPIYPSTSTTCLSRCLSSVWRFRCRCGRRCFSRSRRRCYVALSVVVEVSLPSLG